VFADDEHLSEYIDHGRRAPVAIAQPNFSEHKCGSARAEQLLAGLADSQIGVISPGKTKMSVATVVTLKN
jgi:hypothetical protein